MQKLIIIGLDGADDKFITSLIKKGELKNLKRLIEGGCYGELKSTVPPVTIPAWPAMFSGKNASSLNAVDFFRLEKNYELSYFTSAYWKKHMVWTILGMQGFRCAIFNVPGTNPAYPINGFMVTSTFGELQTYPENLDKEINIVPLKKAIHRFKRAVTDSGILKASEQEFIESAKLTSKLMEQQNWDLFIWIIRLVDIAMHRGDIDNIQKAYIAVDAHLAPILEKAEKHHCNILVVSDHGLKRTTKSLNINTFLEKIGYLKFKPGIYNLKVTRTPVNSKLKSLLLSGYRVLRNIKKLPPPFAPAVMHKTIEWDKTKAFTLMETCHNFIGIWLNTKESFAKGTINGAEEKEFIKQDLINKLREFKDSDGENPVKRILTKEELYPGASRYIPDIFIETRSDYAPNLRAQNEIITHNDKFIHGLYGIFIACGPDIINTKEPLKDLEITDITPTILSMFDIPIPSDIDGRAIKKIFKPDSEIFHRQIKYREGNPNDMPQDSSCSLESGGTARLIEEGLRKLGYL